MPLLANVRNEASPPMIRAGKLNSVDGANEIVGWRVVFQDDHLRPNEFGCQRPVEALFHIEGEIILTGIRLPVDNQRRVDENKPRMRFSSRLAIFEESKVEGSVSDGANSLAVAGPPLA